MSFQEANSRDDFRVAVICALPLEADMVTRVFDVKYKDRRKDFGKAEGDRKVYTTGVIADHNVLLIQMPDVGKIKAIAAAIEARISFRHIQIAFIVGICGVSPTHPETKEDIVLGDCIISRTIVQYDYGRGHSGKFATKSALPGLHNPYIPSLLAMLQTAGDRQLLAEELKGVLQEMHGKSSLEDLYPGPGRDKLYQSGYRHGHTADSEKCLQCVPGTDECLSDCEDMGCSPGRLIKRDRLASFTGKLGSPKVHFGNMSSGDSAIESSSEQDRIAHEYCLIAFEMEGAGVWNSFPTVVIKSASDYSDSHKNKGWQYYAAATAAAGLKAFLQKWTITEKAMSQAESSRWSMASLVTDEALSIVPNASTKTFVDAAIMLDPRCQEAFPSLFRCTAGTGWRSSIASKDCEFSQTLIAESLNRGYQFRQHSADDSDVDPNETGPLSPVSRSNTQLIVPSIDLLRLSIDVGPNSSLSMATINIQSIKPKFGDPPKHDLALTQDTDISPNPTGGSERTSLTTPILHKYPSIGALRDIYMSVELDNEIDMILLDDTALIIEVTQYLIGQAKIPVAKSSPAEQEIFYPANILNLILSEMLDAGLMKESKRLITSLITAIQDKVFTHDDQSILGAFWLTNVHQILSFLYREKNLYHQPMANDSEYGSLIEISIEDLQTLEFNIYFTMTKALKRRLHPMVVPIMIELEDLPSSGFRMIITPPGHVDEFPKFSMNDLLEWFNDIVKAMKTCYLEDSSVHQIVAELLRYIGVVTFDNMLQRKNFLSRERGRQIGYNLIRIEEWCQAHDMAHNIVAFKELRQAVDLFQLENFPLVSCKLILYTCCMLSHKQIHHLLSSYCPEENELVIPKSTMNTILKKISDDELLLLSSSVLNEITYEIPSPRTMNVLEADLPDWLQTPRLKRLAEIVSSQARVKKEGADTSPVNIDTG